MRALTAPSPGAEKRATFAYRADDLVEGLLRSYWSLAYSVASFAAPKRPTPSSPPVEWDKNTLHCFGRF